MSKTTPGNDTIKTNKNEEKTDNKTDDNEYNPTSNNNTKKPNITRNNIATNVPKKMICQNIFLCFGILILLCVLILLNLNNIQHSLAKDGYFKGLQILSRFLIFALCVMAPYCNDISIYKNDNRNDSDWRHNEIETPYSIEDSLLFSFINAGFVGFWPKNNVIFYFQYIFLILSTVINTVIEYYRYESNTESPSLFWGRMKVAKYAVASLSVIIGIPVGSAYINSRVRKVRSYIEHQNEYKDQSTYFRLVKPQDISKREYIMFGCFIAAVLYEACSIKFNTVYNIYSNPLSMEIFSETVYNFLCGNWRDTIILLVGYPYLFILLVFGLYKLNMDYMYPIKSLSLYFVVTCSHRSVISILIMIIMWEIRKLSKDLNSTLFDSQIFSRLDKETSKSRLSAFDHVRLKLKLYIPAIQSLVLYLTFDRIFILVSDFWDYQCDKQKEWIVSALFVKDVYYMLCTWMMLYEMALFNNKWPKDLIFEINYWRLKSWTEYGKNNNNIDNNYIDKEYELWIEMLSQKSYFRENSFRFFGKKVEIRWFGVPVMIQVIITLAVFAQKSIKIDSLDKMICY